MSTPPPAERYLRTEFLHALAHAIRSPLGVLDGVVRELREGDADDRAMLLAMAERNLARLAVLGERLDWVAELEAGTRQPDLEPCDVARSVEEAVDRLKAPVGAVEVRIPRDQAVRADRRWLGRALLLILENAQRFARTRTVVSLRAENGADPAIVVEDDGPGMDTSVLESVFDRYRSGRVRGADHDLALGLSLARDYLRAMGGDLTLATDPRGTRCSLSLPHERGPSEAA